jgi:hypothetical protein
MLIKVGVRLVLYAHVTVPDTIATHLSRFEHSHHSLSKRGTTHVLKQCAAF